MTSKKIILIALGAAILIGAGFLVYKQVSAPRYETFALLTEDETVKFRSVSQLSDRGGMDVTETEGPLIKVSAPNGRSLVSPVDFDIRIEPNNGVPVNMSSIRIEYRVGPAWVNVTGRIMKYASIRGSRLFARGAELPAGNHLLRVTVADKNKRKTQATVKFSVN